MKNKFSQIIPPSFNAIPSKNNKEKCWSGDRYVFLIKSDEKSISINVVNAQHTVKGQNKEL